MFRKLARVLRTNGSNAHLVIEAHIRKNAELFRRLVNKKTMHGGYTLLTFAVCHDMDKCAVVLIKRGASPNKRDRAERHPLQYAETKVMWAMLEYGLKRCDENVGKIFAQNDDDLAAAVVRAGVNVNKPISITGPEQTLLSYAVEEGLVDTVEALLQRGADVMARDATDCTALELASALDGPAFDFIEDMLTAHGAVLEE
jgi:hypothetical protein